MPPYTPSNLTLAPSKTLPTHNLLLRRSLTSTVFSIAAPSASLLNASVVIPTDAILHRGVGPVILQQPSPSRPVDETTASAVPPDTSPRLAYLAILAIPLIFLVIFFFYIMQRGKQKPAKHIAPPSYALRSETARAHSDAEVSRVQQLPRDRIRAMNSVPRDHEAFISPPIEHQIFSPRPPSPPPDERLRPPGHYLVPLSVPGFSEPHSPVTSITTFASDLSACPPTPCTPTFADPSESITLSPHVEPPPGPGSAVNETEEARFTWDFRCMGAVDKLSCFSLPPVLDISRANKVAASSIDDEPNMNANTKAPSIQEKAHAAGTGANHVNNTTDRTPDIVLASSIALPVLPTIELSDGDLVSTILDFASGVESEPSSSPSRNMIATAAPNISIPSLISDGDSTFDTTAASIVFSLSVLDVDAPSAPKSEIKSDEQASTSTDPSVLGLNLDVTPFSDQVVDALASTTTCVFDETSDLRVAPYENDIAQQASANCVKKRPILSKPHHRTLAPTTSNLKVHAPSVFAGVNHTSSTSSPVSSPFGSEYLLGTLIAMVAVGSHSYLKPRDRTGMGRNRASSETNLRVLRKSYLSGAGININDCEVQTVFDSKEFELSGKTMMDSEFATTGPKDVLLCSSLSMPLYVELACLSSISRRLRVKHD